jgi:hypothetical protein
MPKLYFSSEWVDQANLDEVIQLQADTMVVRADGKSYRLTQAARFLRVDGGEGDPNQLVGRVKSTAQLQAMGAEAMAESVILGDTAYGVQPGYIAEFLGQGSPLSVAFR